MNPEEHIEQQVMNKIEEGYVSQRPKFLFVLEKYGLLGVIIASIGLAIGIATLVAFSIKASRAYEYLSFGVPGIPAFFEAVPIMLCLLLIVVFAAALFFFMKTDMSYQKPLLVMVIATVGFVVLSGGAIAYSRVSEKIQMGLESPRFPARVVRPFLPAVVPAHKRGIVGEVVEVGEEYVALETKRGTVVVDTSLYDGPGLDVGSVMMVVGGRDADVFQARGVRIIQTITTSSSGVVLVTSTMEVIAPIEAKKPHPDPQKAVKSETPSRVLTLPEEMPRDVRTCFETCLTETRSLRVCRGTCGEKKVK